MVDHAHSSEKPIKTGLASYGMSGQLFHAPFIDAHPLFELTAITERSKKESRKRYPQSSLLHSFDELLSMNEIELVIINTPDATHYDFACRALKAGKHVVVEKPFTTTVAEGEAVIALAKREKRMVAVYQNRRWDADFLTVKKLIKEERLGRLVAFQSTFSRFRNYIQPGTWKEVQGGMTYNLGSHLIDQSLSLFGLPQQIYADIGTLRTGGVVDDYFMIHLLGFACHPDLRITLKAGYLMCAAEPRFVLHGTEGSYVKEGVDPQEERLKQGHTPTEEGWGIEPKEAWGYLYTTKEDQLLKRRYPSERGDYLAFYETIYRHLRHGESLETDASNILPVIRVIEAAKESSRRGKVVNLS